ncbi:MAG: tetratricopeptide repeat protein [Vicinamibacterales bacterium]
MKYGLLVLIVVVCLAVGLPATVENAWSFASSPHFEIYTTVGTRRARETLTYFESLRAALSQVLNVAPPSGRPVRLIVFANQREFRPYRVNETAAAYFRPGVDRDYIVMPLAGADTYRIATHEYAHLVFARPGGRYPLWLNEGLAEYFATLTFSGRLMTVGTAPADRVQELALQRLLPLDRIFAVTTRSPEYRSQGPSGEFYAESWALTHMLLRNDHYSANASRFLSMVRTGAESATALESVFQKPLKTVLSELHDYVYDGRFMARTTAYTPPESVAILNERALSTFDAGLVMADLLAAGREDRSRARSAFEELARQKPDDLRLLEARATFEARSNQPRAALPIFARAIELGSTNPGTYRDYAELLGATDPERAEQLLRAAVSLDPADVRTRVRLAQTLLVRSQPADALATLDSVADESSTDAFAVVQIRVNAYLALKRMDQALGAARQLDALAVNRLQHAIAARLLARSSP